MSISFEDKIYLVKHAGIVGPAVELGGALLQVPFALASEPSHFIRQPAAAATAAALSAALYGAGAYGLHRGYKRLFGQGGAPVPPASGVTPPIADVPIPPVEPEVPVTAAAADDNVRGNVDVNGIPSRMGIDVNGVPQRMGMDVNGIPGRIDVTGIPSEMGISLKGIPDSMNLSGIPNKVDINMGALGLNLPDEVKALLAKQMQPSETQMLIDDAARALRSAAHSKPGQTAAMGAGAGLGAYGLYKLLGGGASDGR